MASCTSILGFISSEYLVKPHSSSDRSLLVHLMLCKYTGFDGADGMDLLAVPSVEEKSA